MAESLYILAYQISSWWYIERFGRTGIFHQLEHFVKGVTPLILEFSCHWFPFLLFQLFFKCIDHTFLVTFCRVINHHCWFGILSAIQLLILIVEGCDVLLMIWVLVAMAKWIVLLIQLCVFLSPMRQIWVAKVMCELLASHCE